MPTPPSDQDPPWNWGGAHRDRSSAAPQPHQRSLTVGDSSNHQPAFAQPPGVAHARHIRSILNRVDTIDEAGFFQNEGLLRYSVEDRRPAPPPSRAGLDGDAPTLLDDQQQQPSFSHRPQNPRNGSSAIAHHESPRYRDRVASFNRDMAELDLLLSISANETWADDPDHQPRPNPNRNAAGTESTTYHPLARPGRDPPPMLDLEGTSTWALAEHAYRNLRRRHDELRRIMSWREVMSSNPAEIVHRPFNAHANTPIGDKPWSTTPPHNLEAFLTPMAREEVEQKESTGCDICLESWAWPASEGENGVAHDDVADCAKANEVPDDNEEDVSCSNPTRLPCGHFFGKSCLSSWLEKQNSCPMCRCTIGPTRQSGFQGPVRDAEDWMLSRAAAESRVQERLHTLGSRERAVEFQSLFQMELRDSTNRMAARQSMGQGRGRGDSERQPRAAESPEQERMRILDSRVRRAAFRSQLQMQLRGEATQRMGQRNGRGDSEGQMRADGEEVEVEDGQALPVRDDGWDDPTPGDGQEPSSAGWRWPSGEPIDWRDIRMSVPIRWDPEQQGGVARTGSGRSRQPSPQGGGWGQMPYGWPDDPD